MYPWEIKSYSELKDAAGSLLTEKRRVGVLEVTIDHWRLIEPILYTMVSMSHAIFRGVPRESYSLNPSMFRHPSFHEKSLQEKNDYITRCFDHFRDALRGRRGPWAKPLESYSAYETWTLGRHFGVENTMLDWTHSPFVALFFAFADRRHEDARSIYCLKRNVIERVGRELGLTRGKQSSHSPGADSLLLDPDPGFSSLEFYKPLSDENFRMIHQQGLCTVSRSPHAIEEWVEANYPVIEDTLAQEHRADGASSKLELELRSGWVLLKINIAAKRDDPAQILRYLNRMNINDATLFPDAEGASRYANMQGDIKHY